MPTSPDYIKQWKSYGKKRQSEILNAIAMRRIGKPEEIANAVMFFSSDVRKLIREVIYIYLFNFVCSQTRMGFL